MERHSPLSSAVTVIATAIFVLPFIAPINSASALTFSDVNSRTSYRPAIEWVKTAGIVKGYSDGTFRPDACVKRAELLKMVYVYLGKTVTAKPTKTFIDVRPTDWFYNYVNQAIYANVASGYGNYFKPDNCITREEALKISANALFDHPDLSNFSGPVYYDDKFVADIKSSDWSAPYANFLFQKRLVGTDHTRSTGTVKGIPVINFFPKENMSRKEVAELIYRFNQNRPAPTPNPTPTPTPTPQSFTAPVLDSPANGKIYNPAIDNQTINFQWHSNEANHYVINLRSNGYNTYFYSQTVYSNSANYTFQGITPSAYNGARFYWTVTAYDTNGKKLSANENYFDFKSSTVALVAPVLQTPYAGYIYKIPCKSSVSGNLTFTWATTPGAIKYTLYIKNLDATLSFQTTTETSYTLDPNLVNLDEGARTWWVRAYDTYGNSKDSSVPSFTVQRLLCA